MGLINPYMCPVGHFVEEDSMECIECGAELVLDRHWLEFTEVDIGVDTIETD
jgi:hypothetical protein